MLIVLKRLISSALVLALTIQLVACTTNTPGGISDELDGLLNQEHPSLTERPERQYSSELFIEPIRVQEYIDIEETVGGSKYLYYTDQPNKLNIYESDLRELERLIGYLYNDTNSVIVNHIYAPGVSIWFDRSGVVTETWIRTVSQNYSFLTGYPNIYEIMGISNGLTGSYQIGSLLLDDDSPVIRLYGLSVSKNIIYIRNLHNIAADSTLFVTLSRFLDSLNGDVVQSAIYQYSIGMPLGYHLTSRPVSSADFDNPAANITFLNCSGDSFIEMDLSEVDAISSFTNGYLEDFHPEYDGSSFITSTEVLVLDGYWYLTILPYYQQVDPSVGIRPIDKSSSFNDPNASYYPGVNDNEFARVNFSAENLIVLCFPIAGS